MVNIWNTLVLGLAAIASASPDKGGSDRGGGGGGDRCGKVKGNCSPACGKYNFVFAGLPWNHPAIARSGFTPQQVEAGIRADIANITRAGYNIKAILLGPEDSLDFITQELKGVDWTGTGVGFGIRGSPSPNITRQFTDIIQLFREEEPRSRILFNYSPVTSLWAIQQYFPLPTNCTDSPGKDLVSVFR
ncbi:hypothetical protein CSOJ01_09931 [Colletotrichum sojae]|uniref:Uncharacterized protein n=1 Tax=Colletotrichum sojae TaxID=2175907 RepID=A0A8H6J1M4_9PEZI|nr:hypothetical protein CSOJ01_09931 [Colletotrichum sojae]